ncbi:hypothetical protein M9H77_28604 [Catharanthus roseus]|uniref:Uncharacterized protein n=1 Tax=Catharanthus roseus TaxID=4058 RepID=A0ACC0AGT6_CATRO|nr:hypothetical protein M9H77_28604 [Catharanthus roseus]
MVSKIIKRTPTKSIKNHRQRQYQRRGRKSPIKNASAAASVVVASINKSIYTCHRRLIKIFSKLVRIATPKKKTPRKKGYQLLEKDQIGAENEKNCNLKKTLFFDERKPLPPLVSSKKKTIFLDLDETLVHSKPNPPPDKYDFIVRPVIDGEKIDFFVLKRPFLDEFLEFLNKEFEIVIFTAGIEEYASLVLDRIDKKGLISHRLYRDSCRELDGKFVKDLAELGRDLNRVVIVDDNPNSYALQPQNAIPIRPFIDDIGDEELKNLIKFFEKFNGVEDMKDIVKVFASSAEEDVK